MKTHCRWFQWLRIIGRSTLITGSYEHRWLAHNVPRSHYVVGFTFEDLDACKIAVWLKITV